MTRAVSMMTIMAMVFDSYLLRKDIRRRFLECQNFGSVGKIPKICYKYGFPKNSD